MHWERELIVCGAGFAAGLMNAIAGGGTMVTFPVLLWAGLGAMDANMTSTVALFPGMPLSAWSFRNHLGRMAHWLKVLAPVAVVGGLAGGVLLLWLGSEMFEWIVPWLLLLATVLLLGNDFIARWLRRKSLSVARYPLPDSVSSNLETENGKRETHLKPWAVVLLGAVAVYGGYFGAGIGIMMLATLGLLGLRDMNQMNALKVILALLMNLAAVVWFIAKGQVAWHWAGWVMAGSIAGYYAGSHLAMRIPGVWVRGIAALIGLAICVQLFLRRAQSG